MAPSRILRDDRFHPVPSISFLYRNRVDETINLSYECLTSPEVRQTLVSLLSADPTLFNQLSVPTPLAPVPPPPEHGSGSYPEDQEHEDDEKFVDSSLSIDEVVAWIADEALGEIVDLLGDEDEGIDGFCHEESHGPVRALEPFNARVSTSYWPRWDGCSTGM
jgi:hypothetical protein